MAPREADSTWVHPQTRSHLTQLNTVGFRAFLPSLTLRLSPNCFLPKLFPWRTVKYEEVYLKEYVDGADLYSG